MASNDLNHDMASHDIWIWHDMAYDFTYIMTQHEIKHKIIFDMTLHMT